MEDAKEMIILVFNLAENHESYFINNEEYYLRKSVFIPEIRGMSLGLRCEA